MEGMNRSDKRTALKSLNIQGLESGRRKKKTKFSTEM